MSRRARLWPSAVQGPWRGQAKVTPGRSRERLALLGEDQSEDLGVHMPPAGVYGVSLTLGVPDPGRYGHNYHLAAIADDVGPSAEFTKVSRS